MSQLSIEQVVDAVRNEIATKGMSNADELVSNYCNWCSDPIDAEKAVWDMINDEF